MDQYTHIIEAERQRVKGMRFETREEAFQARTIRLGSCLIWIGIGNGTGYGTIRVKRKSTLTHRYAWQRANGPIPEGMEIDHLCHNKLCCEIAHLRLVTSKQNKEHRQGAQVNSKSGIRGVCWDKSRGKWAAQVRHNGRTIHLGRFDDIEEADRAAQALRDRLFTHHRKTAV